MLTLGMMLAEMPSSAVYVHPVKLAVIAALFTIWVLFAQWVDKDTVAVNTRRQLWNMASLGTGALGLVLLFFLPVFFASVLAYLVVVATFMTAYIVHRNGLVVEEDRVCTPQHIRRIFKEGFRSGKESDQAAKEVKERVRLTGADRQVVAIPEDPLERETYRVVQDILFDALFRRANFVELIPAGQVMKVRLLVDGLAHDRDPLDRAMGERILGFFKGIAGLNLEERRKPQKGQILGAIGDTTYDLILRTEGSTAGERLRLRVVGPERSFKVQDLGLTEEQLEVVRRLMHGEKGLMVVSAPPGGGLSTTMYSLARSHDAFLENIQTVEYEAELELENITQNVYQPQRDRPFSEEVLRVVRADPDVVVLPEIRDKPTALVASEAAAKKQTVYVGLRATDVFDALRRWAALVNDRRLLSRSLMGLIHQRLVRRLCAACKAPYRPDAATLRKIHMPPDTVLYRPPEPQVDKHGNPIVCQNCHGMGYVGRTGVFNVLEFDEELRQVIAQGGSLADVKAAAIKKGMRSLQQQALHKVVEGITSIEEVVRATRMPGETTRRATSRAAKPRAAPQPGQTPGT